MAASSHRIDNRRILANVASFGDDRSMWPKYRRGLDVYVVRVSSLSIAFYDGGRGRRPSGVWHINNLGEA